MKLRSNSEAHIEKAVNPLMPGGNKKVTHTYTSLHLSAAGLFKYV